jgi:hypothetical protein
LGTLKGKDHSEELLIDGRIISKLVLGELGGRVWIGFMWLRIWASDGFCEHGNERSVSIKGGEFLD